MRATERVFGNALGGRTPHALHTRAGRLGLPRCSTGLDPSHKGGSWSISEDRHFYGVSTVGLVATGPAPPTAFWTWLRYFCGVKRTVLRNCREKAV